EGDGNTAPVHHRDGAVTRPGLAVDPHEVPPVLNTNLPSEGDAADRHSLDVMHRARERDLPRRAVVLARPVVPLAVDQVRRTSTPVLPVVRATAPERRLPRTHARARVHRLHDQ